MKISSSKPPLAIVQKQVQFCGRNFSKSKKKVRWVLISNKQKHQINCSISFYSGKKRASHNGYKILDIVDNNPSMDFTVWVGTQRVMFLVDQKIEYVQVEAAKEEKKDPFGRWKNSYSAQIRGVYQQVFGE